MRLHQIAYAAALLPLLTIHLCYLLAASNGHVDWCIPHLQSCTSISATGRQGSEFFLFKAFMIPAAMLLGIYWFLCEKWLSDLGNGKPASTVFHYGFLGLTILASAGLVLYSVMLGAIGDLYQLQRRIGVTTFFGLSYIAQLIVTWKLSRIDVVRSRYQGMIRVLEVSALLVLLVGIGSVVMAAIDEDYYDTREDAVEWVFTLLLCLHGVGVARLWQLTGFSAEFSLPDRDC